MIPSHPLARVHPPPQPSVFGLQSVKGKPEQTAGHGMKVVESRGRERLGKTCGRPWNVLVGGGGGVG